MLLAGCSSHGSVDYSNAGTVRSGAMSMRLEVPSKIVGEPQTIRVEASRDGTPVTGAAATIEWSMDGMPMERRAVALTPGAEPGSYEERGFAFSMAGTWHARVVVRESTGATGAGTFAVDAAD